MNPLIDNYYTPLGPSAAAVEAERNRWESLRKEAEEAIKERLDDAERYEKKLNGLKDKASKMNIDAPAMLENKLKELAKEIDQLRKRLQSVQAAR